MCLGLHSKLAQKEVSTHYIIITHPQSHVTLHLRGHVIDQKILSLLSQGARPTNLAAWWLKDPTQHAM